MECRDLQSDFLNFNSFTFITHICEGGGWFLLSICLNVLFTMANIYLGNQRYRYERLIQLVTAKYDTKKNITKKWTGHFRSYRNYLAGHQFISILNFLFLVHTNIVQVLLSAFLNVVFRLFLYQYDYIDSDNGLLSTSDNMPLIREGETLFRSDIVGRN